MDRLRAGHTETSVRRVSESKEATPGVVVGAAVASALGLFAFNLSTQPLYFAIERNMGATAALASGAIFSELGLFAPLVPLVLLYRLDPKRSFGLRRPRVQPTLAALLATVGGGVLVDQVMFLTLQAFPDWRSGNLEAVGRTISEAGLGGALALLIPLALMPALIEEALCRGILLRGLQTRYPSGWVPLLVTALYFGSLHFDPLHISAALLMGLLLGWIALRTGSLWPPVLCHLLNNAISLLTPALGGPDLPAVLNRGHSLWVVVLGGAALILGCVWLFRATKPSSSWLVGSVESTTEGE